MVAKGADNVVPDFLSRPWQPDVVDVGLHALSHPRMEKVSTFAALGLQTSSHVFVLPVCGNDVAVFHEGLAYSLPMASLAEPDDAEGVVRGLVETLGGMQNAAVGYVGACGGVAL